MDITQIQDLIGWLIGILSTSILAIAVGVFNIIRSGRMSKREVKGADLTNEEKEVDVAKAWKGLAAETARETLEINKRIKDLEDKSEIQEDLIKQQESKIADLENKIIAQEAIIAEQTDRINKQDGKIRDQEEEIILLKCELENARAYNKGLIEQLQNNRLTPITEVITQKEDCSKIKSELKKGKYGK